MYITHLGLSNFRNYLHLELDLPPHIVILQGGNAQGKSNLLEAIYFLATTRSPRATGERELINWSAAAGGVARLSTQVERRAGRIQVEISLALEGSEAATVQRRIRVNGLARRALDLVGQIKVVLFTTRDIELIGGAPSLRRRYLDVLNSQVDRRYLRALQRYQKVLLQRNHLLKMIKEQRAHPSELAFWDQELVEAGSYLILQRQRSVAALDGLARDLHRELSGGQEELSLAYISSLTQRRAKPETEPIGQIFSELLSASRGEEIACGMTLAGPHRDDLRFSLNGVNAGVYGSRGQQRTLALSLRLADARFLASLDGDSPLLLLDDVLSELDEERRGHLLRATPDYEQVIITATDLDRFPQAFLTKASCFRISQGGVHPL